MLKNLRAALVFADPAYAEQGSFSPGYDTLTFVAVPDLAANTTPLTEGTAPTTRAMSISTVTVSTQQYGDLVGITDVAKVKSPIEIVDITSERITRQAAESLDSISRDVIAAGGTQKLFGAATRATRGDIVAGDNMKAEHLRKLHTMMVKAKIPAFSDGYYRLMVHPNVAFDLRNDTATGGWIDVNKYATPETLLRGELGRLEGFRVMEVVNAPTFSSGVTVYASIALGDIKGWGAGSLQSLRTYHVAPGGDHSDPLAQRELIGWKVMWGTAVLNNSYYIRAESAATNV